MKKSIRIFLFSSLVLVMSCYGMFYRHSLSKENLGSVEVSDLELESGVEPSLMVGPSKVLGLQASLRPASLTSADQAQGDQVSKRQASSRSGPPENSNESLLGAEDLSLDQELERAAFDDLFLEPTFNEMTALDQANYHTGAISASVGNNIGKGTSKDEISKESEQASDTEALPSIQESIRSRQMSTHRNQATNNQVAEKMLAFQDQRNKTRVLMMMKAKRQAKLFDFQRRQELHTGLKVAPECQSLNLVYAHPYLVEPELTCEVDLSAKQITLLERSPGPSGAFSTIFMHESSSHLYFLMNGRNYPHEPKGYVQVKAIAKQSGTSKVSNWELLNAVEGYSGGMVLDEAQGDIYFTTVLDHANMLYVLKVDQLLKLIQQKQSASFDQVAKKLHGPFSGFSMALAFNDNQLLYNNRSIYGDNPSFFLERSDFLQRPVILPDDCQLLGNFQQRWLFNCEEKRLELIEL